VQPTAKAMIDYDSPAARTLLAIAGRRIGIDVALCRLAFVHLGAASRLRRGLQSTLTRHRLSELQFAILVVLFENEAKPIAMAVLARHAAVSRSAVTDALDSLEALRFASRAREHGDRRILLVRLTAAGRKTVDQAINDYLHCVMQAATSASRNSGEMAAALISTVTLRERT